MEATKSFIRVKPTVFNTAFHREPGFKAEVPIKYRIQIIQCCHYDRACGGLQQKLLLPYFGRL